MEIRDRNLSAKTLLELLDADHDRILSREEQRALTSAYAKVIPHILSKCKVVGSTLNTSGEDSLRASEFAPFAMLCDEAGQCLESDSMIAMNWYSLSLVSLIGDTDQIPPTVLSTNFNTTSGARQRLDVAAAELPESRQHATGSVIDHTFYVIGGRRYGQL